MKIPEVLKLNEGESIEIDFTVEIDKHDSAALRLLDALYKALPDDSTFGDADKVIQDMAWWNITFNAIASKHEETPAS